MNHISKNPIGIDKPLNSIQAELYTLLKKRWATEIDGYGRVYKNEKKDGSTVPMRLISEDDYEDVFFDDNTSGNFFFMDNDVHTTEDNLVFKAEVKVVFMVNLEQIFDDNKGRQDERARRDAVEMLRTIADERYIVKKIEKGVKAVFVNIDKKDLKVADIDPLHTFAVVLDLSYYLTNKCD